MQKKKPNKPIQITLTEDQIASIIERASKTHRGLKVESLEDRIAPSVIGVSAFGGTTDGGVIDPNLGGLPGGNDAPLPVIDPNHPDAGIDGTANFDPKASGGDAPPLPVIDPNSGHEGTTFIDPKAGDPLLGGDPNFVPPPSGDAPVHDVNLPGDPVVTDVNAPIHSDLPPMDPLTDQNGDFVAPNPGFDGNIDPNLVGRANDMFTNFVQEHTQTSGNAPSAEELEEYRSNVLRQLRG